MLSIFTTITNPRKRGDCFEPALECYKDLADEVVVIDGRHYPGALLNGVKQVNYYWPEEFSWEFIGQQFQRGYEECSGDWVMHCDIDFLFHEADFGKIRQAIKNYPDAPAISFYKYQFIKPDRYNLKSRLAILVNRKNFGPRIMFDGGGDLCQPTLDGIDIDLNSIPQSGVAIYNFEKICKTKEQIKNDVGRMARAWHSHFGEYKLGGPDDESAYTEWLHMVVGRYQKPQKRVDVSELPKYIHETIKGLTEDQWGYNGFGELNA